MSDTRSDAWLDGWHAHRNGVTNNDDDNPYNERRQHYSYTQWIAGWCARFSALKHGHSLELDDYSA
jgi:hypothetical protein